MYRNRSRVPDGAIFFKIQNFLPISYRQQKTSEGKKILKTGIV